MKIAHRYLIRAFPWLGLAIFLATPLWAIEMSNGPYKITRDDVNASGQVLKDVGGNFYLTGSLSGVEATQVTGGSFKLTSGLPAIYFYPDAVKQVTPTGISISSISMTWNAPRGEVPPFTMGDGSDPNYPKAFSYVVKYSSVTPLDAEAAFEAASTAAQSLTPQTPGQLENLEIPGLLANTSYYLSIRTYDGLEASKKGVQDHNGSYPAVSTHCFTWARTPVFVDTNSWTFSSNDISPVWWTMNGRPNVVWMTFDVQVALDNNFNSIVYSSQTTSNLDRASIDFHPLFQMTDYYFRVRAYNGDGVHTQWSDIATLQIPAGLPVPKAFSGQDVDQLTANWWPNECSSAVSWAACLSIMDTTYPGWSSKSAGPYFHAQLADNSGFSAPMDSLTQRTTYYAFSLPSFSLSPNTTYWAHVQTVPEAPGGGPGNAAAYQKLDWTMTGVYPGIAGTFTAYTSSASFTWNAPSPGNNGGNVFYYRVDVSTDSNYGGIVYTSTVPSTQTRATDILGMLPNTYYYARLVTMNGIMIPSAKGQSNFSPQSTHAKAPIPQAYSNVTDYQLKMSWDHNGNNPEQTKYEIQVTSQPSGNFGVYNIDEVTGFSTNTYTFSTPLQLLANTTYFGQIKALSNKGSLFDSEWVSFDVPTNSTTTRPTSASNMAFTGVTTNGMTVGWSAVNPANTAQNSGDTFYQAALTSPAPPQTFNSVAGLSQPFGSLLPNVTYYYSVAAHSRYGGADSATLSSSTSTLALPPINGAFSVVTSSGLTVSWSNPSGPSNPIETGYLVALSTNSFGSISDVYQASNTFTHSFTGLMSNATYYAHVWGVNHCGALSSSYLDVGSTVTLVNTPSFAGLQPTSNSVTILVNPNGNDPSTKYHIWDLNPPNTSTITTLSTDGTNSWTMTGLPVNSSHTFNLTALNRAGQETPVLSSATWTLAAADAQVVIGNNSPDTIQISLNTGTNPPPGARTQFAIEVATATPDGNPVLTGLFLRDAAGTDVAGHPIYLLNGSTDTDSGVWRDYSDWVGSSPGGVIVSSALAPGRSYAFVVLVRNGDNGGGPNVVSGPGPGNVGLTQSGMPVIYFAGLTGQQSTALVLTGGAVNGVWTNDPNIGFFARGAFQNHWEFSRFASPTMNTNAAYDPNSYINHPGWNGQWDPSSLYFADGTNSDAVPNTYRGGLQYFHANVEGPWYLYVVGDAYFPPYFNDDTQNVMQASPYLVYVDTTPANPLNMGLITWQNSGKTRTLVNGGATGTPTPYFTWSDPDQNSPGPNNTISPTVGYSYSFSSIASDAPTLSSGPANPYWIPASGNLAVQETMGISVINATYYFQVRSLDKAGNWSITPASFTYVFNRDYKNPTALVDLGADVTVPCSLLSVAVSTAGVIHIYFDKLMNTGSFNSNSIILRAVNDNAGNPIPAASQIITTIIQGKDGVDRSTATLTPVGGLQAGYRYLLTTNSNVQDTSNNPVDPPINKYFYTLMNPNQRNVVLSSVVTASTPSASVSYVTFDASSWSGGYAGLAVNEAPATEPMAAPAIASLISHANKANNNRDTGGFGKPFVVHEFNLYDSQGVRKAGVLSHPAQITMHYNDANGDGIVDETEGTPNPVRVAALGIYWLDDDTGVWVRLPTSKVDLVARTVTAQIGHFSVYGLLGAPELSLADAYAYPVPYKPSIHKNGIRFKNLSSIATIKIYTVNGELVNTLGAGYDGYGNLTWNPVVNSSGSPLASGVYIYVIENPQEKKTGKIMVVR